VAARRRRLAGAAALGVADELLENWYVYNPERVALENSLRRSSQGDDAN
jgi:hypothetical protein